MTHTLDAIARPSGTFAMVAMDQRESLRHMFDLAGSGRPDDDVLIDFKVAVAEELGPLA
jgi:sulfofructosephosphate aldolase